MKHPVVYYLYYAGGTLFVGAMGVVIYHMLKLWFAMSHM